MASVHDKERSLHREISTTVESAIPGTEVLAVELTGPERMTVYIDHPGGVDLGLCERVTGVLDSYRREYGLDVSSPGLERPLRTAEQFARFVGERVYVELIEPVEGRRRLQGPLSAVTTTTIEVAVDGRRYAVPLAAVRKAHLAPEF